jgi:enoyl-CoA hydratase/carnithine racemase
VNESSISVQHRADGVAIVTIVRPKQLNALDRDAVTRLAAALREATAAPAVRAILLTGAGGNFCSGADLKTEIAERKNLDSDERVGRFHEVIKEIVHTPKPVVAAIDGAAVSFGADMAFACDLRVMSTRAYLQEKFSQLGLMPDGGGTFWLPRLVGSGRALEYLMLATKIDAARARELGLTNRVVEPDQLLDTAMSMAVELAAGPPLALARIKAAVRDSWDGSIDDALARERKGQVRLLASEDVAEGVAAWMQRREPEFSGK